MTFLTAGWLTLTIPWSLLTAWLWRRRPPTHTLTAAFLWGQTAAAPSPAQTRRVPPVRTLLLLAAMLCAILALAKPAWRGRVTSIIVVVDPSLALGARVEGQSTLDRLTAHLAEELAAAQTGVSVRLGTDLSAKTESSADVTTAMDAVRATRLSARSASPGLWSAVADASNGSDLVFVLTDRADAPPPLPANVHLIRPDLPTTNVGLTRVVAVARPSPQVMIGIANFSDQKTATLTVTSGDQRVAQQITLPTRGAQNNVFVDLPTIAERVDVTLEVADALPIDNRATIIRTAGWPTLALEGDVPDAARRFAQVYNRIRVGEQGDSASSVIRFETAPSSAAGILFAEASETIPSAAVSLTGDDDAAIADSIDGLSITAVAPPRGAGWTSVAVAASRPVVAIRQAPTRQVWVGLDLATIADDVRFVALMDALVRWVSSEAAAAEWRAAVPDEIQRDWQATAVDASIAFGPGIYLDGAGRVVSVAVPAIEPAAPAPLPNVRDLVRQSARDGAIPLDRPLCFGACALVVAAVLLTGFASYLDVRRRRP